MDGRGIDIPQKQRIGHWSLGPYSDMCCLFTWLARHHLV